MTDHATIPDATTPPANAGARTDDQEFSLSLDLSRDYLQRADFALPGVPTLAIDEPPPLGQGDGPNPARVLGAALGSCLGASLLFCLRKSRIAVEALHTTVKGSLVRNERGRLRIGDVHVTLQPRVSAADRDRMQRCLPMFEDFCVVTASVRQGLDVRVAVEPRTS